MRRHHDMGGLEAEAIDRREHAKAHWEKRIDAIRSLLADDKRRLITVDELRRGIEELGPGAYDKYNYYERWTASVTNLLIEKGIVTIDELGAKMNEVEARLKAEAAQ